MRGKQSVKKGVWYIGGKYKRAPKRKKKQKGSAITFALLASLPAPVLGEIAKALLGKMIGRGLRKTTKKNKILKW